MESMESMDVHGCRAPGLSLSRQIWKDLEGPGGMELDVMVIRKTHAPRNTPKNCLLVVPNNQCSKASNFCQDI